MDPVPNQIGDETIPEQPEFLEDRADRLIGLMGPLYAAANDNNRPAAGLAPPHGQVAAAFQTVWDYKVRPKACGEGILQAFEARALASSAADASCAVSFSTGV